MMLCMSVMATLTFSSCSDEKDEPSTPAAKSVAGTYTADMTCSVMGSESVFENMTFTLTATDDTNVSMAIPSFGNPPMQVPDITITGIPVSGSDGTFALAATAFSGTTDAGRAYSGTVQGSFADNTLTVNLSLQYGSMPMPMICTFTAPKQ